VLEHIEVAGGWGASKLGNTILLDWQGLSSKSGPVSRYLIFNQPKELLWMLNITLVGIACKIMCKVYATIRGEHIPEPKLPQ